MWRGGEKHAGIWFYLVVFTYLSTRTGNDDWLVHQRDLETSHWIKEYLSVRTECDCKSKSAPQSELARAKQSCQKQFAPFFPLLSFLSPFPGAHSTAYRNYGEGESTPLVALTIELCCIRTGHRSAFHQCKQGPSQAWGEVLSGSSSVFAL